VHTNWAPVSANEFQGADKYFSNWAPVLVGYVIFALFGINSTARKSYCNTLRVCMRPFLRTRLGKLPQEKSGAAQRATQLSEIAFGNRELEVNCEDDGSNSSYILPENVELLIGKGTSTLLPSEPDPEK
jgi:hypothetical protein